MRKLENIRFSTQLNYLFFPNYSVYKQSRRSHVYILVYYDYNTGQIRSKLLTFEGSIV